MSDGESVKLKVSEANQGDVGKGIVRVSEEFLDRMGARTLDVVEIIGSRSTAALAVNAYSADQGVDIVRMDGLIRSNAGTSIGQYIEVKKATWSEAKARNPGTSDPGDADLCAWRRSHQGLPGKAGNQGRCDLHHQCSKTSNGFLRQGDHVRGDLPRVFGRSGLRPR